MEYATKPLSRLDIRKLSNIMREEFGFEKNGPFPVLDALEKVPMIFKNCDVEVVDNNRLSIQIPARCLSNSIGGYTIEIRDEIYMGAYSKKVGAYLVHICHELAHLFLFEKGYVPLEQSCDDDAPIEPYRSVEWQAKALAGEVMIPYEETQGLSWEEIVTKYNVSKSSAKYRIRLDNGYVLYSNGRVKLKHLVD